MRSFAFRSIQDQRAEAGAGGGNGGGEESGLSLALHPSVHATQFHREGGRAKCWGPKAKKTDGGMRRPPSPSLLQPHFGSGFFLVCFCRWRGMSCVCVCVCVGGGLLVAGVFFGLRLFLVSSYKRKKERKKTSVTPAALTTVCPSLACPSATHPSGGFGVKGSSP